MPYTHFHDWSFHTHHRRPKGGNHHRAIRRRQRPWRISVGIALVVTAVAGAVWFGAWLNAQGLISSEWTEVEIRPPLLTPVATANAVARSSTPRIAPTALPPSTAAAAPFTLIQNVSPTSTRTPTSATPTVEPTSAPTATPVATHTPAPTSTLMPTRTPRPTTTAPPTPTQIPGRAELYKPIYPPNHMAAVSWYWENTRGFDSIDFDFTIHNDVDINVLYPDNGLYLMLDSSDIAGTSYYFGLQTDVDDPRVGRGRGKGVIFSRWDTLDLANVTVAEGGWDQSSGHEGDFVGVRKAYHWGAGEYRARIAPDGEGDDGRWFGLWITDKATGETTWCGSLRFPYKNGKALLDTVHVSVAEIYGGPGSINSIDIPEWHITMQKPVADGGMQPTEAHISYTNWDGFSASAPNSNITYDTEDSAMHIRVGGTTERTTKEGWISLGR